MRNGNTQAARSYHDATKLSYINLSNKPPLYKSYSEAMSIPLPADSLSSNASTLESVSSPLAGPESPLDLSALARLLYLSAGLIRKAQLPVAGEVHYRAAASAGALFPIEVYVVCEKIPGLDAGVYHFSPADFTLNRLRQGDQRSALAETVAGDSLVAACPVSLIFTANFWRSAWKYRARSYRYCFWDAGTMLANLLAAASASGLPARMLAGFLDEDVNGILGLDSRTESAVCIVPLGQPGPPVAQAAAERSPLTPLQVREVDQPKEVIDYPEVQQVHQSSNLGDGDEVSAWRLAGAGGRRTNSPPAAGDVYSINCGQTPNPDALLADSPLGKVISERGSTRRFAREEMPYVKLASVLASATAPVAADFLGESQPSLLDPYLIVNAVQDLPSGSYFLSAAEARLEQLQRGEMRHEAGHLCFEQALGADASAVVYFMVDLDDVLAKYGNRGYRAAQMEAGILGGRMYLCAHALGLGATGMTFYDDDVTEFFSPHAEGKSLMFLVALGVTHANNRVRPFRSRVGVLLDSMARGASGRRA